jgi:ABC-type transporter Mla subunit MlaD
LNPETPVNELIDSLGELESTVTPLDTDIKDTNAQSGDLLKSLADLNAELDDFNKNGRLGVLQGV